MVYDNISIEPPVLYKYRDWNDDNHKKLLLEPIVYLSAPSGFIDKLDCKIPIRYDLLTDFEIFDKYYSNSISFNTKFDFYKHFAWAGNWFVKSPLRNPIELERLKIKNQDEFDKIFGVHSLTANPFNIKMWDSYANNKKGFCIGYDNNLLFRHLGGAAKVTYTDDLPIIKPFEDNITRHFKLVFYKELKWSYEDEFRTHKFWPHIVSNNDRNVRINKDCIVEFIFGPYMPNEHMIEIKKIISANCTHVKIIDTKFVNNEIKICT